MVLNTKDLAVLGTGKASDHSISAVKFSNNCNVFACAAASNFKIYIHENSSDTGYRVLAVAEKHNSVVTSLDFSVDSRYIQGTSSSGEYLSCKFLVLSSACLR